MLVELPTEPLVLNKLAYLYDQEGDPRAFELAERAYDVAPDEYAVLDTFGWLLVQRGETERGLKLLRDAFIRAPKDPDVLSHLGATLLRLGRTDEALSKLEQALRSKETFAGRAAAEALRAEYQE